MVYNLTMTTGDKLTLADIKHLAKLANLKLSDSQLKNLLPSVATFLKYVSKIKSLDTKNVEETSQVTGQENIFREDVIDKNRMLTQQEALSNAKKTHNGYFVVNAIFDS